MIETPEGEFFNEAAFLPDDLGDKLSDIERRARKIGDRVAKVQQRQWLLVNGDDPLKALLDAAELAFEYFYHRDEMNAKIHAGDAKFSPITFRLAQALSQYGAYFTDNWKINTVITHDGKYEQDKGR